MRTAIADRKNGFLFVGNQLALDFLNTRPVQNSQPAELLPDFAAVVRWFQAAEQITSAQAKKVSGAWKHTVRAKRTVVAMRDFREKLRQEILRLEHGGAIHDCFRLELNRLLAAHPMRTRLKVSAKVPAAEWWFALREPEDFFAPLAQAAAQLFTTAERGRIRKCANCVLHFQDTSKKGTRRWCSMRLCGNRFKVAAYAARQHTQRQVS